MRGPLLRLLLEATGIYLAGEKNVFKRTTSQMGSESVKSFQAHPSSSKWTGEG